MACSLLLLPVLSIQCAHAIRTTIFEDAPGLAGSSPEEQPSCEHAEVTPESPWRFTLNYSQSRGVRHHEAYALRPSSDCTGEDLANVTVIPKIHPLEPLNQSIVLIAVEPKDLRGEAYVCHQAQPATCLAAVHPPRLRFRPHQLLMGLPGLRGSRWLMDLHLGESHTSIDMLEWAMLAITICFIGTTCHAIYVLGVGMQMGDIAGAVHRLTSAVRAENTEPAKDVKAEPCPIYISSPFWESLDAWMNSTSFVVACVSLLRVLLSIQVYTNGPALLLGATVLWPATCGNVLLYCFWMSTCRLQLYTAALSRGICIRGTNPTSTSLVIMGSCVGLLAICALATACYLLLVKLDMDESMNKARELSPFVLNPMASLSSILVFIYLRSLAHHKTQCPMAIDEMVLLLQARERETEEAAARQQQQDETGSLAHHKTQCPLAIDEMVLLQQVREARQQQRDETGSRLALRLSKAQVPIIPEGSFCELCRRSMDPVECAETTDSLPVGPSFGVLDLAWQGKVVHQLSGYWVAILNTPIALFFFLVLTASSVFLAILGLTTKPSVVRFEASQNSLGVLNPPLRAWQTDYELVLHSGAHSFTFAAATKQSSTSNLMARMADDKWYYPHGTSFMATVELDGLPIPKTVELHASGILGRHTKYELSVVRDMELVQCMQIVPRNERAAFPARLIKWGEVESSVFSLPATANRVDITFFHTKFSIGIPTSIEEADNQNMSVLTVYEPFEYADIRLCKRRCSVMARCLASDIGKRGCFYVWGPSIVDERIFRAETQPPKSSGPIHGRLGARFCKLNGSCEKMQRMSENLLRTTVVFSGPPRPVIRRNIRLYEIFDGREAGHYNEPILTFTRSAVKPVAVLCYVRGVNTHVKVEVKNDHINIGVTLDGYVLDGKTPPFQHEGSLTMHLAILMPDPAMHIYGRTEHGWSFMDGSSSRFWTGPTLNSRMECEGIPEQQYSVCGGWRPSKVVSRQLKLWEPEGEAHLEVASEVDYGTEVHRTNVRVRTFFQDGRTPAEFTIQKSCQLDFSRIDSHQARSFMTLEVYEQMILKCEAVDILESDWMQERLQRISFTKEAMAKFHQTQKLTRIFEAIETSDQIANKSEFFSQIGVDVDNGELTVALRGERASIQNGVILRLPDVVKALRTRQKGLKNRYTFVAWACSKLPAETLKKVAQDTFLALSRNYERNLAVALGGCFSRKINYIPLRIDEVNPVLVAIKFQQFRLLRHLLMMSSCCFTVGRWTTYVEYAVAHGCKQCLEVIMMPSRCGMQVLGNDGNSELFFSGITTPDIWGKRPEVAEAFSVLSPTLKTLSFSAVPVETTLTAILYELLPLAEKGYLQNLEYLSFIRKNAEPVEIDEDLNQLFCKLVDGQQLKSVKVLFVGLESTSYASLGCFLRCLSKLPKLMIMDIEVSRKKHHTMDASMFNKLESLQVLYCGGEFLRAAHRARMKRRIGFNVQKINKKRMLQRYFTRRTCRPKPGTVKQRSDKIP